eukprot:CAMPEP_0178964306 /NCGR_PEP_ID=MMETSP0789-20121207/15593_1 /TAXON_ID=3005 /ORGANISM="Rhizosolenia setigera, Strain CCMP 1694" /LENGTH=590 /DNA_ID=CAMNT_0020649045 /DNA_START=51 /DNA_END=1823 /DNA_ORIENTATION=+
MSGVKKIINDPSESVSEFIEGLLYQYPNTLQKLENHNVVLANPLVPGAKVHLLSGGGSGHEPAHAGYIGNGMLTGAILGGIFASPAVSSILAAVRSVAPAEQENGGCLLIVKNYTGDRLNFGMACEMATAEKRKCRMIVVADDCAVPRNKGVTGARGVAGTVFVHKICGAAAEKGMSLDEIATLGEYAASRIGSLGVALNAVTIPGASEANDRLASDKMEIGLGIHGEAGIRQCDLMSADAIAEEMLSTIQKFGYGPNENIQHVKEGDDVAILVNNLGGLSNFEMSILTRSLVKYLEGSMKCTVKRVYVGSFMTSFDMQGASVSVLCLDDKDENGMNLSSYLDCPTTAPAFEVADVSSIETRPSLTVLPETTAPAVASAEEGSYPDVAVESFSTLATEAITRACNALIDAEPDLTKWDTIAGDGDCGITMKRGATEILSRLKDGKLNTQVPSILFKDLAEGVSASMGGTSGILFELFFRSISTSMKTCEKVDDSALKAAFVKGIDAVQFYGGAKVGYRTLVDALVPAADALNDGGWESAAESAMSGAKATASITQACAGRSTYLNEETLRDVPDPGAMAVGILMGGIVGK